MQTNPRLPPLTPAFRPLIASIPRVIEKYGAADAAGYIRSKIEVLNNQIAMAGAGHPDMLAAMSRDGVDAFDMNELVMWLNWRANELETTGGVAS